RAQSVGIFRLWRDLGYAIGAILTGLIAEWANINTSILIVAALTIVSGIIIYVRMKCLLPLKSEKPSNYLPI
ncbi:MAG TPA: hypothetical protein VLA58_11920, partial [Chitinophagaceae bacterium]|nr:hypothetical protein [Chitinophagaceae bacterium]